MSAPPDRAPSRTDPDRPAEAPVDASLASAPDLSDIAPAVPPRASREAAWTHALAVGSLLGLIVLGLAWELVLAPLRPGGSRLALKVLPLCIPLAGLLKHRMYTYRWLSLVVWLYFTEGVVRAWSDRAPSRYYAWVEVILCVLLFVACALHVRLRLRAAHAAARSDATPSSVEHG